MQHAGHQYGQGAANSHQSPPFAHTDISQQNGGNPTSSLRQFRKKDPLDKTSGTDLTGNIPESSQIARVPPHNHYPAKPNDSYYRYHNQFTDYNTPYKEPAVQVKYSEIASSQPLQHVDPLQKHKDLSKEYLDMCNIPQQAHMKQNYPENINRQPNYTHDQYMHKELPQLQVHPSYKQESQYISKDLQYQQYPQLPKYNMAAQCRKYPSAPHENDLLSKLQRLNPMMARSIMTEQLHIRDVPSSYQMDNRMYPQNQKYYPTHNNYSYPMAQPYNYPSSCSYPRSNQMDTRYPEGNISPRRSFTDMNYGTTQKVSPNYPQYNPPEFAQHYQHRRAAVPQEYYQQACRPLPYISDQISPNSGDTREPSELKNYLENWAEDEAPQGERMQQEGSNEQVYVINSSELPPCLENVALVQNENGQYILKSGSLENSVVRIKETTEHNGERTVNLQILETSKSDCMLAEKEKDEGVTIVPCSQETTTKQTVLTDTEPKDNAVSVIKDMPVIEEKSSILSSEEVTITKVGDTEDEEKKNEEDVTIIEAETPQRRTQRIFSVDDIMNIGNPKERKSSLQLTKDSTETCEEEEEVEYKSAISVEGDSVIIEIGGALVQLNVNYSNEQKILSVLPLSESLVIDVNGNYATQEEAEEVVEGIDVLNEVVIEDSEVVIETSEVAEKEVECEEVCVSVETTESEDEPKQLEEEPKQLEDEPKQSEDEPKQLEDDPKQSEDAPKQQEEKEKSSVNRIRKRKETNEKKIEKVQNSPKIEVARKAVKKPRKSVIQEVNEKRPVQSKAKENDERKPRRKSASDVDFPEATSRKRRLSKKIDDLNLEVLQPKVEEKKSALKEEKKILAEPSKNVEKSKKQESSDEKKSKIEDNPPKVEEKPVLIEEQKKKTEIEEVVPSNVKCKKEETTVDEKRPKSENKIIIKQHVILVPPKKTEETVSFTTKASKKLYVQNVVPSRPVKKDISKLEATVNKIKSMKEKATPKKVTFNPETEIREFDRKRNEETDRRRVSWEEYNNRKRKIHNCEETPRKSVDDIEASTHFDDTVIEKVEMCIESAMINNPISLKKESPRIVDTSWEDEVETPRPEPEKPEEEDLPQLNRGKCIIDVNEFCIEGQKRPTTDALQQYREEIDSKLNSLNLKIPKPAKPKLVEPNNVSLLIKKFLSKSSLNDSELEKVKKIIEFKRKIEEDLTKRDEELKNEDSPKKKKKRFRNLYAEDSSDSDKSTKEKVEDYSVFQRNSQGVPKLIFKRKSGLPQPFVRLERSQAAELLVKKRKLY